MCICHVCVLHLLKYCFLFLQKHGDAEIDLNIPSLLKHKLEDDCYLINRADKACMGSGDIAVLVVVVVVIVVVVVVVVVVACPVNHP